jgi:hypothetical protein
MNDLIEFLKNLIMTTVQIDKKYRETIPKIQSEMKTVIGDSDGDQGQGQEQEQGKPRRRNPKKMKLGKDGLYPHEDDHVRSWWDGRRPLAQDQEESTTKSTEEQDIKLHISRLRSRETQLQMIIILEILALEPLLAREAPGSSKLPSLPPAQESLELPKEMAARRRNKHNLPLLLDVHADRLCIWQSTASDEFNAFNESQPGSRSGSRKSLISSSDPLKDFCVDIIVPLYVDSAVTRYLQQLTLFQKFLDKASRILRLDQQEAGWSCHDVSSEITKEKSRTTIQSQREFKARRSDKEANSSEVFPDS